MNARLMESKVSTVALHSNVFPVIHEEPYNDKDFIGAIHDPTLLQLFYKRFKGRYQLSSLQNDERAYAIHCMFAETDDFPWGTIETELGVKVVCLCENYRCRLFSQCRPNLAVPSVTVDETEETETRAESAEPIENVIASIEAFNESFYESLEASTSAQRGAASQASVELETLAKESYAVEDIDYDSSFEFDGFSWDEEAEQEEPEEQELDIIEFEEDEGIEGLGEPAPTEEQLRVITLPCDSRAIVNAGPGTGKTYTLIEKLKYMLQEQNVPSEEILVLSFSRAAVNVIEDRLSTAVRAGQLMAPWQGLDIRTFDKFATWILYSGADMQPESVPKPFLISEEKIPKLNYEERIIAARNIIANWDGLFDNVSHVFIDETQDLVSPRADLVLAILNNLPKECGFTLLGDSCQSIYDYGLYVKEGGKQVKKGITSTDMIAKVRSGFGPQDLSLIVNHRIKDTLPYSLENMRNALIEEDASAARNAIQNIIVAYGESIDEIRKLDKPAIASAAERGTLGILTRTNGEALYISSLLRNKSISHHLRQADREEFVSRIIADVFYDYESDSIDKEGFIERALAANGGSEEECTDAWYELTEACQGKSMGARYLVEDLLQCLNTNAKRSAFFTSSPDNNAITIGTIHSAKGREYDAVWLAVDDLEKVAKGGNLDECKVAYVALSRPVHELELKRFETSNRIMGYGAGKRRHFCVPKSVSTGQSRTKRKRISNLEPIDEIDIDYRSFGSSAAIQRVLRDSCTPDSPISLMRNHASEGVYPTYTICLESDEGQKTIGLLKSSFARGFAQSLSLINGGNKKGHKPADYIDDCPEAFDDLYVENVITCISSSTEAPSYAKRYGNQGIWYGITVTGLAKANSRSY